MRLLNAATFEFRESHDEKWLFGRGYDGDNRSWSAEYAILSHTWGEKEVSFKAFNKERKLYKSGRDFRRTFQDKKETEPGFWKIVQACLLARERGHDWVWIDTCCIDKRSSAELSEAINSMMAWYRKASVCYAYLADVEDHDKMHKSRWHTRGWCLQELFAPTKMYFFDRDWNEIGERNDLRTEIARGTGIGDGFLPDPGEHRYTTWRAACAATKMSWMARRTTTRVEDMAYCMLGLFDVNMPLLYGEGERAFERLQLEILRQTDDESLFAWDNEGEAAGFLAPKVSYFKRGSTIRRPDLNHSVRRKPYHMTNRGLEFSLPLGNPDNLWTIKDPVCYVEVGLDCVQLPAEANSDAAISHVNARRVFVTIIGYKRSNTWYRASIFGGIHTYDAAYPLGWAFEYDGIGDRKGTYQGQEFTAQQMTFYIKGPDRG
jgi:hypothetical protein